MEIWNFIKNNIYVKNLLLAVSIVFIILLSLIWWLKSYTHHGQAVVVPDVKGLTVQQAAEFFEKNNLRFEVVDSVYNKTSQPGTIVETIPVHGTKVKENRNIYITINAFSSQMGIIPDVKDQSQRQATAKLNAVGFKYVQLKYVPNTYKDLVLGLECKDRELIPGIRLPLDSRLVLLVGDGSGISDEFNDNSISSESSEVNVDESWIY